MCKHQTRAGRGFTLVELLVVMSVIAILLTLLVPTLGAIRVQANVARTNALIEGITMGITSYKQVYAALPPDRGVPLTDGLDKSAECLVYFLSGGSISYDTDNPPAGYPWKVPELFGYSDADGNFRRNMNIFYQFNKTALVSADGDSIPEVIDPWQNRFIYNSGTHVDYTDSPGNPYNQMGEPKHNLRKFDLFSAGPDKDYTTMDDNVCNWNDSRGYQYSEYDLSDH
jgi:prepilin-type N-terminal cleavage/methylation domain-containing protein